jgi:hypothetical protein
MSTVNGMDARLRILETSLILEDHLSRFLAMVLDIQDPKTSRILGNKSCSLSFASKVDIFLDLGAIDSNERGKFDKFMSIRNQFMHNIDASSYCLCMDHLDGVEKYLLRQYPPINNDDREINLQVAVNQLMQNVLRLAIKIEEHAREKLNNRVEGTVSTKMMGVFLKFLEDIESQMK